MNTIAGFRLCTLTDEQLIEEVDRQTDEMYTNQKIPTRTIPAQPNKNYDLLIGELLLRYRELLSREHMRAKELILDKIKTQE